MYLERLPCSVAFVSGIFYFADQSNHVNFRPEHRIRILTQSGSCCILIDQFQIATLWAVLGWFDKQVAAPLERFWYLVHFSPVAGSHIGTRLLFQWCLNMAGPSCDRNQGNT